LIESDRQAFRTSIGRKPNQRTRFPFRDQQRAGRLFDNPANLTSLEGNPIDHRGRLDLDRLMHVRQNSLDLLLCLQPH
jgi:hypothetical protein